MTDARHVDVQRWLGLSLRLVLLACLLTLITAGDAAPYVTTSFSAMTRGLSQMHSELQTPDHVGLLIIKHQSLYACLKFL